MIEQQISEAISKYNFVKWSDSEHCLELYADNHTLSSLRKCEGYFIESIIERQSRGRAWFLDFGIWIHSVIEHMYTLKLKNQTCDPATLADFGANLWTKMEFIKYHKGNKNYEKLGGFSGAAKLLLDYWRMYGDNRESYRIIGTELPFGAQKEVYLGEFRVTTTYNEAFGTVDTVKVKCYYSGRIDIIVDDGYSIGVMDTKSTGKFSGDEIVDFKPHDGMEGYVFSLREIVKKYFPEVTKPCNRIIINHVSVADCKDFRERFKRTPISFTHEELEEWRLRQLRTFKKLFELTVLGEQPDWNTEMCSQMYYQDCPYKSLHRVTPSDRAILKKSQFVQLEAWNPYRNNE